MKKFFFPMFLAALCFMTAGRCEVSFQKGELTFVEREYLKDVLDRFEEIDSVAVVGTGCESIAPAALEEREGALVVSFSQRGSGKELARHEVFVGDPVRSILDFKERYSLERFDVIFVTVQGEYREILRLLYALKGVAHDQTILILMGVESKETHLAAWKRCVEKGEIEETNSLSDGYGHGWKEGRYLFVKSE